MTAPAAGSRHRFFRRLGFRKAVLLALTLLPLGIVLVTQIDKLEKEAAAREEAALTGATLLVGRRIVATIHEVRGAAAALATTLPSVFDDPGACDLIMQRFVAAASGRAGFAGFIGTDGDLVCASGGARHPFGMAGAAAAELTAAPRSHLIVAQIGAVSQVPVLIVMEPVFAPQDALLGYIAVSVPQAALQSSLGADPAERPVALVTFDRDGTVLTGQSSVPDRLPANRALTTLAAPHPITFRDLSNTAIPRLYAVVPLVDDAFYLLGSWQVAPAGGIAALGGVSPIVFTGLMWLASIMASVLGAEYLVNRHIRSLQGHMAGFAAGRRDLAAPVLRGAPQELSDMNAAYTRLTHTIETEEDALADMIRQKDTLLREVHHRVKNNLQLIASIMNMQIRQTASPVAKDLLKRVQDRMMSLATIHKELYQTSGQSAIRADELLRQIGRQVLRMADGSGQRLVLDDQLDPVTLASDQAVPLVLLLTETLNNAIKFAARDAGGATRLSLSLRALPADRVEVVFTSLLHPKGTAEGAAELDSTGLGSLLMNAFAQQLGSTLQIDESDGRYVLRIAFDIATPPADDPDRFPALA